MPQQYAASDQRTGLQVTVTGEFPEHPEDRVRIARTSNLFTRLMATILATENETERRERFKAVETQLEVAEALIRGDMAEVQRLIRSTMRQMGVSEDHLHEVEEQLRRQFREMAGDADLGPLEQLFGDDAASEDAAAVDPRPLDDRSREEIFGIDAPPAGGEAEGPQEGGEPSADEDAPGDGPPADPDAPDERPPEPR